MTIAAMNTCAENYQRKTLMPILDSKIDTRSEQFQQNSSDMMKMLSLLADLLEEASEGGGVEAIARLRSRDKMPIRERISHALDRDSPFLEISPLAAWRSPFARTNLNE